jgi:antitoxin component HigA of HigAB toxin-antitoxin module
MPKKSAKVASPGRSSGDKQLGSISNDEITFLEAHSDVPVPELARRMRRTEKFVKKHLAQLPVYSQMAAAKDWIARLHAAPFWSEISQGFVSPSEQLYFQRAWASYMEQFGSLADILPTDELMVKDLIMLDIMSQRAVCEQASLLRRIQELERLIQQESDRDDEDRDRLQITDWRNQLNALYAAKTAISKNHLDYQNRKDVKLRDLKGSRDQRFKQLQESRRNIFELIKTLSTQGNRIKEGRINEKIKVAAEAVAGDWNDVIEYDDGSADKPFLSPEGEIKDQEDEEFNRIDEPNNNFFEGDS